jgi:(2Fe-2S) ferredoxin
LAADLASQPADGLQQLADGHRQVWVCQYTNCRENGSTALLTAFKELAADATGSPCQGQCNLGPTVRILPDGIWYYRVQPADVPEIVATHLQQGQPIDRLLNPRLHPKY